MSSENTIKSALLSFGTAGTQSQILSSNTATTNPYPMPRQPYTVSVLSVTTGTSIASATVVWQGSNDSLAWIPINTAAALSTNASTASSVAAAGFAVSNTPYAFGRGVVSSTGTGLARAYLGS